MNAYDELLAGPFEGREPDITEENLQARIRGNLVMALSNKFGWLVLTTGNKSEMSVGYATLYGDMAGGFAVLKDVYKGWVYRLVALAQRAGGRASWCPSRCSSARRRAELRHEQRDEDSLPPYDVLDAILEGYIEGDLDAGELVRRGLPAEDVERVIRMVDRRRVQAPPGPARHPHLHPRVRPRPAPADHEPLRVPRRGRGPRRLRALGRAAPPSSPG